MSNEDYRTDGDVIADFERLTEKRDPTAPFRDRGKEPIYVFDIIREMKDPNSPLGAEFLQALRSVDSLYPHVPTPPSDE